MLEAAKIKGERGICGCGMLPVASTDNSSFYKNVPDRLNTGQRAGRWGDKENTVATETQTS